MNIKLKGTFFACQAAAKIMKEHGGGRIINLSSQAGFCGTPDRIGVLHDKGRGRSCDEVSRYRLGSVQHQVNGVAPTSIHTPGIAPALSDPAFHADTVSKIAALHRIGEPTEVAGAVVFLASPAMSLISARVTQVRLDVLH